MKNAVIKSTIGLILGLSVAIGCANASEETQGALPTLNTIQTHTFSAPYSCGSMSYEKSALFLSDYAKQRNAPDLLFNGACLSEMYIQASTAGDDFSLISDLGEVSLESVSASKALNYERTMGQDNVFKENVPVKVGHTYVVLIAKDEIRALWVLKVNSLEQGGQMTISYAVKSYSIQKTVRASRGFDWGAWNK